MNTKDMVAAREEPDVELCSAILPLNISIALRISYLMTFWESVA